MLLSSAICTRATDGLVNIIWLMFNGRFNAATDLSLNFQDGQQKCGPFPNAALCIAN